MSTYLHAWGVTPPSETPARIHVFPGIHALLFHLIIVFAAATNPCHGYVCVHSYARLDERRASALMREKTAGVLPSEGDTTYDGIYLWILFLSTYADETQTTDSSTIFFRNYGVHF